jgi:hypothetical protein
MFGVFSGLVDGIYVEVIGPRHEVGHVDRLRLAVDAGVARGNAGAHVHRTTAPDVDRGIVGRAAGGQGKRQVTSRCHRKGIDVIGTGLRGARAVRDPDIVHSSGRISCIGAERNRGNYSWAATRVASGQNLQRRHRAIGSRGRGSRCGSERVQVRSRSRKLLLSRRCEDDERNPQQGEKSRERLH